MAGVGPLGQVAEDFPGVPVIGIHEAFLGISVQGAAVGIEHQQDGDAVLKGIAEAFREGGIPALPGVRPVVGIDQDDDEALAEEFRDAGIVTEEAVHLLAVAAPIRPEIHQDPLLRLTRLGEGGRELLFPIGLRVVDRGFGLGRGGRCRATGEPQGRKEAAQGESVWGQGRKWRRNLRAVADGAMDGGHTPFSMSGNPAARKGQSRHPPCTGGGPWRRLPPAGGDGGALQIRGGPIQSPTESLQRGAP